MQLRPRKKSFWKRVSLVMRHCLSLGATVITVSGITRSSVQAQTADTSKKSSESISMGRRETYTSPKIKGYPNGGFITGVIYERPYGYYVDDIEKSFFDQIKSILLTDKEFLLRKGKKKSQEKKQN